MMTTPPPYYPQPPYGYPQPAPLVPRTNGTAIAAFIFGLLGFAIVPVILGHLALNTIQKSGERGTTFAVIGLVLGYGQVAFYSITLFLTFWAAMQ
jgi:hypothetical protein